MPYRLSFLAEQDLEEIWSYVAKDASPTAADRLIDAIVDRFELLAEQPDKDGNGPSSARAFARSLSRAMSSTTAAIETS